jgi:2-keto-4-pentenoate hydratase
VKWSHKAKRPPFSATLHALKWLADDLVRIGKPLRAEFVITGAIGPAVSAKPGDAFDAEITGVGLISTRFAD